MGQVIWSPTAVDDAEGIAEYIARDSVDQASLFMLRLYEATDALADYPLMGRANPKLGDSNSREVFFGAYRIMYQVDPDAVIITRVIHGSRDWNP
ncbi:MAG: type II toxin-antitoxin system RelE/ParE family toxin [Phycisphaerae bacterium]|nr:type II toxin-antitoxin system RelE/ParE family toxin [Phycisphaerae bacterium]